MDRDDEIDKILKQKFENKILPSEEFENNMKKIINEQKSKKNKNIYRIDLLFILSTNSNDFPNQP